MAAGAAPSFLMAGKRRLASAISGLSSVWKRPRPLAAAQAAAAGAAPEESVPVESAHQGDRQAEGSPLRGTPSGGLLAGRAAQAGVAASGGLKELMCIYDEEQGSLFTLDSRLMASMAGEHLQP